VKSCLDPAVITGLQYDEFLRKIQIRGVTLAQQKRLSSVWQSAFKSIGCEFGISAEYEARMMGQMLGQVRMSIADTQQQIKEVSEKFPEYEYLLSIPGFGPDISAKTLGAIGNPFRFDNASQVVKLVGLDLSASRSGKNSDKHNPIHIQKGQIRTQICLIPDSADCIEHE
jgi:transposase